MNAPAAAGLSAVADHCPLCLAGDIHDTTLRAVDHESGRLHPVYECRVCTGRFIADRPQAIDKVDDGVAAVFASPERVAEQRAHFARKKSFDESDYPYSLIRVIEAWSSGRRVLDLGCGASQLLPLLMRRGFDAVGRVRRLAQDRRDLLRRSLRLHRLGSGVRTHARSGRNADRPQTDSAATRAW